VKIFYTDQFAIPLPEKHTFPKQKYALLRKRLLASGILSVDNFSVPHAASLEDITRVHAEDYIHRLRNGELTPRKFARSNCFSILL
jgi:acetoin utilization deacetylase AcuC-like enzyme